MPEKSLSEGQPIMPVRDIGDLDQTATNIASAASLNATVVKASAGRVYSIDLHNFNAAARYVKIYDKATTPAPASDVPCMVIPLPAGGNVSRQWPSGVKFLNGISFVITSDATMVGATALVAANDVVGKIGWM